MSEINRRLEHDKIVLDQARMAEALGDDVYVVDLRPGPPDFGVLKTNRKNRRRHKAMTRRRAKVG